MHFEASDLKQHGQAYKGILGGVLTRKEVKMSLLELYQVSAAGCRMIMTLSLAKVSSA